MSVEELGLPARRTRWFHLAPLRLLLLAACLAAASALATAVARWLVPPAPSPLHQWILLKNALLPFLLLSAYAAAVRLLEGRRATEIRFAARAGLFPIGLLAGVVLVGGYELLAWGLGWAHVGPGSLSGGWATAANEWLVPWLTAVGEELLFRAVLFRILEETLGTAVAIVASSALFGLAHLVNPGADALAILLLASGLGVLLALCYAATRNLWLPIGLHFGWNLSEGFLFGLPDSGTSDPLQLLHTTTSGPALLVGGAFGPDGSLIAAALCALASLYLLRRTVRAGLWVPLRLRWRYARAAGP